MKKILITAGTSALALKVKKKLVSNFDIQLGESGEIPSVLEKKYIKTPIETSPSFAHQLLKIAIDNNIDKVLPLKELEIKILSQNLTLFNEYGISILTPTPSELEELLHINTNNNYLQLALVEDNKNLFNHENITFNYNGLFTLSDDNNNFSLIIV